MPTYQEQPYITGQIQGLKEVFRSARSQLMRIGVLGDSRTDPDNIGTLDRRLEQRLNYLCFKAFGQASETPISRAGASNYSTTGDPQFCVPRAVFYGQVLANNASATLADFSDMPPGFSLYRMQTSSAIRGVSLGLDPTAGSIHATAGQMPHGGKAVYFPSAGVVSEHFFRKRLSIEATRLNWVDVTKSTSVVVSVSSTGFTQNVNVGAFVTNDADGGLVKYRSPVHNTPSAGNVINSIVACQDDTNAIYTGTNGFQWAGGRFVDPSRNQGMVIQSFGAGNYDAAELLDRHGSMGPAVNAYGPYHAWFIVLGANDYGSPSYATPTTGAFKTKIQDLIDFARGATAGGTARTPIVLCSPYARTGSQSAFDAFVEFLIELTQENNDVVFVNTARILEDAGYSPTNTAFTTDEVHMKTNLGVVMHAEALFTAIQVASESGSVLESLTAGEIVAAINADATQTAARNNAATAATEIGKVPRLSAAIAAGAAARRNKVAATADTLDETLGAVP